MFRMISNNPPGERHPFTQNWTAIFSRLAGILNSLTYVM